MNEADEAHDVKAGSLIYDDEYGEGIIELTEAFSDQSLIFQLDLLKDWIMALTLVYNTILDDPEESS